MRKRAEEENKAVDEEATPQIRKGVEEIMVREDLRKTGIGRNLMDAFEDWRASRSSKLIGLATRRAISFYEALGYENSAVFYRKLL